MISIHPPRAGWDMYPPMDAKTLDGISIHPPRAGWDLMDKYHKTLEGLFQSTHPVRGGTAIQHFEGGCRKYFNPPTPCGVGRV